LWLSIVREAGYCHLPKTQLSRQAFNFKGGGEVMGEERRGEERREEKRRRVSIYLANSIVVHP
jgi:hypothetical protein